MKRADARVIADIRTLDNWRETWGRYVSFSRDTKGRDCCVLRAISVKQTADLTCELFMGETLDAARHAAAEWVRKQ